MKKLILLIVLMAVLLSSKCFAMDLTVQWDENADAEYYIIYWGDAPRAEVPYTNHTGQVQKGTTEYVFKGLEEKTYYFGIKAFNSCGNSSDFSTEVSNGVLPGVVSSVIVKTCVTYEAVP